MTHNPSHALLEPLPPDERLSGDDLAARAADEHLADALAWQQLRADGGSLIQRGVCCNCGERCHPSAVYCDPDCRADHEDRLRCLARRGG